MTGPDKQTRESGNGRGRDIEPAVDPDYEAILSAVTDTARGRWFLDEYARRNRTADTRTILGALRRIESSISHQPDVPVVELAEKVAELTELITRARIEIAAVPRYSEEGPLRCEVDDVDFEAEADPGKTANRLMHESAERIQEIVWSLRERQVSPELCDVLDRHAVDIQGASRTCTATLKSMDAMARALLLLEGRIEAVTGLLSAAIAARETSVDGPTIFEEDSELGRFLDDIELIDVDEEIDWRNGGSTTASDIDLEVDDADAYEIVDEPAVAEDESDEPRPADTEAPQLAGPMAAEPPTEDVPAIEQATLPAPAEEPPDATEHDDGTDADIEPFLAEVADEFAQRDDEPVIAQHDDEPLVAEDGGETDRDIVAVAAAEPLEEKSPDEGNEPVETPADDSQVVRALPAPDAKTENRDEAPSDLAGLTFDQKMILFS